MCAGGAQGGGWCESEEACTQRAFAKSQCMLGSSREECFNDNGCNVQHFQPAMNFLDLPAVNGARWGGGLLNSSAATNPLAHDWNKVIMMYCDGGSYSGNNATAVPVTFNGTQRFIHYRGARNLDFALGTLARDHGMGDATDVLISGDSAGGLASYWHADRFASAFPKAFVATVPDSGWVCISFPLYQLVLPALLLLGGTRSEHLRTADSQVFHRGPDEACMALGVAVDRRGDEQHCGLGRLLRCCRRPAW